MTFLPPHEAGVDVWGDFRMLFAVSGDPKEADEERRLAVQAWREVVERAEAALK